MTVLTRLRAWLRPPIKAPNVPDTEGLLLMLYQENRRLRTELLCYRYLVPRLVEPSMPPEKRQAVMREIIANDVGTTSMGREP